VTVAMQSFGKHISTIEAVFSVRGRCGGYITTVTDRTDFSIPECLSV
jgi:hypothetical protein